MAVITTTQTAAKAPLNVALMDELRRRSNGIKQPGEIFMFHTYNGTLTPPVGAFPCNGTVINQANYDNIHGSGKWASDVGSSLLDGKYAPNFVDKYAVGAATTTATGTSSIPTVGNSNHTVNVEHTHSHTHTGGSHNHQWHKSDVNYGGATDRSRTWNTAGTEIDLPATTYDVLTGNVITVTNGGTGKLTLDDCFTTNETPTIGTSAVGASVTSKDIQPESTEVIFYIMII